MAKSQGNILKIKDFKKNINGQVLRLALISTHYKQPLDWNDKLLEECQKTLNKWYDCYVEVKKKVLIPRNTPIPVRQSDVFSTSEANQSSVEVHVWQGERQLAADNKSLGKFKLSGIPPAPRGVPQVQIAFDIDSNGLLEVSATDRTTGRKQSVSINGGSNLNQDEVNNLIREAQEKA